MHLFCCTKQCLQCARCVCVWVPFVMLHGSSSRLVSIFYRRLHNDSLVRVHFNAVIAISSASSDEWVYRTETHFQLIHFFFGIKLFSARFEMLFCKSEHSVHSTQFAMNALNDWFPNRRCTNSKRFNSAFSFSALPLCNHKNPRSALCRPATARPSVRERANCRSSTQFLLKFNEQMRERKCNCECFANKSQHFSHHLTSTRIAVFSSQTEDPTTADNLQIFWCAYGSLILLFARSLQWP